MEHLKRTDLKISGNRAVVIGRSNIAGMPVALLKVSFASEFLHKT